MSFSALVASSTVLDIFWVKSVGTNASVIVFIILSAILSVFSNDCSFVINVPSSA